MLQPLLAGEKIRLDSVEPSDAETIASWYKDDAFARHFDTRPALPYTRKDLSDYIDDQQKSPNAYMFALRRLEDNTLVGYTEVDHIQWAHRVGWFGLGIGPAYQGLGYGYEAVQLVLRFAFHEVNLHRVQLSVFAYNQRAIKLYEKIGFQREGILREFIHRDGQRYDMYLYAILAHEWAAQQQK